MEKYLFKQKKKYKKNYTLAVIFFDKTFIVYVILAIITNLLTHTYTAKYIILLFGFIVVAYKENKNLFLKKLLNKLLLKDASTERQPFHQHQSTF